MRPSSETLDKLRSMHPVDAVTAAELIDELFIERLIAEFSLPNREDLLQAIESAAWADKAARGPLPQERRDWRNRYADQLDELESILTTGNKLLHELRYGLSGQLAQSFPAEFGETPEEAAERLDALRAKLILVGDAARTIPRLRTNRRGRPREHAALRAMVRPLVEYWTIKLDRPFTQNHNDWPQGADGIVKPKTEPVRFLFEIVEFLAPGEGQKLKTIGRDFATYENKRRKRPPFP
jgi:hypothetical protein